MLEGLDDLVVDSSQIVLDLFLAKKKVDGTVVVAFAGGLGVVMMMDHSIPNGPY